MRKWRQGIVAAVIACGSMLMAVPAAAQQYPDKPIRIVLGFAAGGPTDVVARVLAQHMSSVLGQPIIVENKTGANALIATEEVARANPDGYTLLFNSLNHNVNAILMPDRVKYDPIKSFAPVTLVGTAPMFILTDYNAPFASLADLLTAAKAQPGGITFGSAGNDGSAHLAGELLSAKAGVKMTHVPFRGNGPALAEVMAGRVSYMFYPAVGVADYAASKRVRVLAIAAKQRHPDFPDVPTTAELGLSGLEATSPWNGLLAPAGTPEPVVQKLAGAVNAALAKPEVKERFRQLGLLTVGGSPAEFTTFLKGDFEHWAAVIRMAGVKAP